MFWCGLIAVVPRTLLRQIGVFIVNFEHVIADWVANPDIGGLVCSVFLIFYQKLRNNYRQRKMMDRNFFKKENLTGLCRAPNSTKKSQKIRVLDRVNFCLGMISGFCF